MELCSLAPPSTTPTATRPSSHSPSTTNPHSQFSITDSTQPAIHSALSSNTTTSSPMEAQRIVEALADVVTATRGQYRAQLIQELGDDCLLRIGQVLGRRYRYLTEVDQRFSTTPFRSTSQPIEESDQQDSPTPRPTDNVAATALASLIENPTNPAGASPEIGLSDYDLPVLPPTTKRKADSSDLRVIPYSGSATGTAVSSITPSEHKKLRTLKESGFGGT